MMKSNYTEAGRDYPAYATVDGWCKISGLNRTAVYREVNAGNLRVVKVGRRTMVDVRQALDWMASLPGMKSGKAA